MVVTHHDTDHVGGAQSVVENVEVGELISSLPAGHPLLAAVAGPRRCAAGEGWAWDGVRFELLHPATADARARKSNDLSCVLKVSAGGRSMLPHRRYRKSVGGRAPSARDPAALAADVLLVPHHGSRSSSTAEFLAAVGAGTAVIPAGYRNRFGHPNAEVMDRYSALKQGCFVPITTAR